MIEPIIEKAETLSRVGDFYTKIIREGDRNLVSKLAHVSHQCRIIRQLCNAEELAKGGGYIHDNFKLLTFTDDDVIYYGMEKALQKRVVSKQLEDSNLTGNSREANLKLEDQQIPLTILEEALGVNYKPITVPGGDDDIVLPENQKLVFGLKVPRDMMITSIVDKDGSLLLANVDFQTTFGLLVFYQNPIHIFQHMRFMAQSYVRRMRNLYCYPLGVDVYGAVDCIFNYYKNFQSVHALYLASAQAAGFPIVRNDCAILSVKPLLAGVTYFTTDGTYDAPFPHTHYTMGQELEAGHIIGGSQLYRLSGPTDPLPMNLKGIELDYATPVNGLIAPNKEIRLTDEEGNFKPEFEGSQDNLERYWRYIKHWQSKSDNLPPIPETGNGMVFFLTQLCRNRYVIAQINRAQMPTDMQLRLLTFLQRELPLGAVLTLADLPVIISEKEVADV